MSKLKKRFYENPMQKLNLRL